MPPGAPPGLGDRAHRVIRMYNEDDVRLVVVADPGAGVDGAALFDWLKPRLPRFMPPRYIEFVPSLPRTPNNKIKKFKLVAQGLPADVWDAESSGAMRHGRPAVATA